MVIRTKLKLLITALMLLTSFAFTGASVYAATNAQNAVCEGIGLSAPSGNCSGNANTPTVDSTLVSVINILSFIVGAVSVIMIIVGGFKYVTAGGDSNAVGSAKTTLIYALVGLIVAAVSQILARFVLTRVVK